MWTSEPPPQPALMQVKGQSIQSCFHHTVKSLLGSTSGTYTKLDVMAHICNFHIPMAKWDTGTGTHPETYRSACSGSRGTGPCVVVCVRASSCMLSGGGGTGQSQKQSSYFTQAVGNLTEETEAVMEDTLETVPVEKTKSKGSVPQALC